MDNLRLYAKGGEVMKQVGQGWYTYLGIIELDTIKETEMKEKITKEYK